MKILFVCGGLEPGRDGVGDYSRRMAAAARDAGWDAALLAIHDGAAAREIEEAAPAPTLRLPRGASWSERRRRAAEFIAVQRPDWVSLQFVAYAFDPRGIVFRWVPRLAALLAGRRVHVMFHEAWIGASTEYGPWDRLVGAAQRLAIRRVAHRLQPRAAHTSNAAYVRLLAGIGVRAGQLALPGNIPIAAAGGEIPGWPALDGEKCWVGGVFGAIHPRWQPQPWLGECASLAAATGRRLVLVQLGEMGSAGAAAWARLAGECGDRIGRHALGPLPPEEVSRVLARLDFGIATSPWALIEKSGATAAFLDHGVPVLVPRDDWQLRDGFTPPPSGDPLLFRSADALFRRLPARPAPRDRIAGIARQLLRELAGAAQ